MRRLLVEHVSCRYRKASGVLSSVQDGKVIREIEGWAFEVTVTARGHFSRVLGHEAWALTLLFFLGGGGGRDATVIHVYQSASAM